MIPYDISLDNLSNGLLEEENYYLYFELRNDEVFEFLLGNEVVTSIENKLYKIKKDQNYIFKYYNYYLSLNYLVQVIPCENSELNIFEYTINKTDIKTTSKIYSLKIIF